MIVSAKTLRVLLSSNSNAVALKAMGSHADRFNMGRRLVVCIFMILNREVDLSSCCPYRWHRSYPRRVDDPLHEWLYLQAIRDLNLVVEFNHSFITLVGSNASAESVSVHA